jgi:hypothetical protein
LSIVQVRPRILVICLHFSGVVAAKNVFQAVGLVSLVTKADAGARLTEIVVRANCACFKEWGWSRGVLSL